MAPSSPERATSASGENPYDSDSNIVQLDYESGLSNAEDGADGDALDGDGPDDNRPDPLAHPAKRRLLSAEVLSMWNLARLESELGTHEQCLEFAEKNKLILASKMCRTHRIPMTVRFSCGKMGSFRCHKSSCRYSTPVTRAKNTWFDNARMSLPQIFYLMYAFARKFSYDIAIHEGFRKGGQCLSRSTIWQWYGRCRETIITDFKGNIEVKGMVGGPGKVVHVDKSKFAKRSLNKARTADGHWVLGILEDESEDLRLEFFEEDIKRADVLIPLIAKHVLPGTTIRTDRCGMYDVLGDHGYVHVKCSRDDADNPFNVSGAHTDRLASQCWRVVKRYFCRERIPSEDFADWVVEYQWRRNILENKLDPFVEILNCVRNKYGVK